MLNAEDVLNAANELYRNLQVAEGNNPFPHPTIRSRQVKALCTALCDEFNKELIVLERRIDALTIRPQTHD